MTTGFDFDRVFSEQLTCVPRSFNKEPWKVLYESIEDFWDSLSEELREQLIEYSERYISRDNDGSIRSLLRPLPAESWLKRFSFDEMCKLNFGEQHKRILPRKVSEIIFQGRQNKRDGYNKKEKYGTGSRNQKFVTGLDSIKYEIIYKLVSSMKRYKSQGRLSSNERWNTLVNAYNSIPRFNFGIKGFTTRIDWTTYSNPHGTTASTKYNEYLYIDGVLSYMIHYKGKHVMTVGFSIREDMTLLLSQVQLKKHRGNRWLYKIPMDRLDWVIRKLEEAFPDWQICLADGLSLGQKYKKEYDSAKENFLRQKERDLKTRDPKMLKEHQEYYAKTKTPDFPDETAERLIYFYNKELEDFERVDNDTRHYGINYYCLIPAED